MSGSLESNADGSLALFINGDLQFDSTDEFIYHEGLVLPALAIAQRRIASDLKVLVVGGGDGLVAREVLKSSRIASMDLVDYDPEILAFANKDLLALNESSLLNSRVTVHIKDAWEFVDECLERCASYDVIVSDLTVAENVDGARFHSIEWYSKLRRLLTSTGVLAVNAVSPQATPKAYWSIFNGMIMAGLHARPYHMHIPSFSALGYGQDWGFFIASAQSITETEFDENSTLFEPRKFLIDVSDIRNMFVFPDELFALQKESRPALVGSDLLLRYLSTPGSLSETSGAVRCAFSLDTFDLEIPEADSGLNILSPALSAALATSIFSEQAGSNAESQSVDLILHGVMDLMPSLEREHTYRLITEFLDQPDVFLRAIDLPGLVGRLLRRAAELPACLVAELELLRERLEEWAGDHLTLLTLGRRIVTVLTLTIVIGNVLFPDMAYAKGGDHDAAKGGGEHSGDKGAKAAKGDHHDGDHARNRDRVDGFGGGVYGTGNRYWDGTRWVYRDGFGPKKKKVINSLPQQPNNISDAQNADSIDGVASSSVGESQSLELGRAAASSTRSKLVADKHELVALMATLTTELQGLELSQDSTVNFGSHLIPRAEAIRLTRLACRKAEEQIGSLDRQLNGLAERFNVRENTQQDADSVKDA